MIAEGRKSSEIAALTGMSVPLGAGRTGPTDD
jgi:hypothetical protein